MPVYKFIYLDTDVSIIDDFSRILHLNHYIGLECCETNNKDDITFTNGKTSHLFLFAIQCCEKMLNYRRYSTNY